MDTLNLRFVFDRKKVANASNIQESLEIYVYDSVSEKKAYLSTGIELLSTQFVQKKGEKGKIVKHLNATSLNGAYSHQSSPLTPTEIDPLYLRSYNS